MERIDLLNKYWEGNGNLLVRCWMYIKMANSALNDFRSYAYVLTGIYLGTPYLQDNLFIAISAIVGISCVAVPIMILFGRWLLYKAGPAMEYASKIKGSTYQYLVEDATLDTEKHLKDIRNFLIKDEDTL